MKLSKVAAAVAALLATDAKPSEAQIIAACIAADKKGGKDEGGLGPVEIENKAKDEKDDPEKTNDEFPEKKEEKAKDKKGKDEETDVDGMDDEQPKKSANGNSGAGGAEPAKDKKGMDTQALIAAALAADRALTAARREVEPILGVVTFDSAAEVYKAALVKLGVAVDGVDASAYPALYKMARETVEARTPVIASDAARVTSMAAAIPGYARLR